MLQKEFKKIATMQLTSKEKLLLLLGNCDDWKISINDNNSVRITEEKYFTTAIIEFATDDLFRVYLYNVHTNTHTGLCQCHINETSDGLQVLFTSEASDMCLFFNNHNLREGDKA